MLEEESPCLKWEAKKEESPCLKWEAKKEEIRILESGAKKEENPYLKLGSKKRGDKMSTKSILKTVVIKDNASARRLIRAMELAEKRQDKRTEITHNVSDANREELRAIFGLSQ